MELLKLLCYKKKSLFGEVNDLNRKMKESDNEGWSQGIQEWKNRRIEELAKPKKLIPFIETKLAVRINCL